MTLKTTILLLGITITLTTVSGLKCYVSRGYQSLEDLYKNKADPNHSRQCNSTYRTTFSSCFSYTGFGDGETYPFESGHGTQLNGTIVEDINSQCQDGEFACSSIPRENNTNSRSLPKGNCTRSGQVQCPGGKCIPTSYLCDGANDCRDKSRSDEQGCSRYTSYRSRPRNCVSNYGICDGRDGDVRWSSDGCADGSDERQDFCAARYSNEEFGRHGCLGNGQELGSFFGNLVSSRHPGRSTLLDELIAKTKAKADVSMSGVKLVGTGSTNFQTLLDETLLDDLQEVNIDLVAKVDKLSIKLKLTGDFTSAYKAFKKLTGRNSYRMSLSEILDVFDDCTGPFGTIEQSMVGNVKDTYKKVVHLINWVETNIENQYRSRYGPGQERDNEWSSHGNETINVEVKLNVSVGTENFANIVLTGEAYDAVKGYFDLYFGKEMEMEKEMEGNLEFCDYNGKCSRFGVCRTDLCNTFKPFESNNIPVLVV